MNKILNKLFVLIIFFISIYATFAENISVELLPNNITANVGDHITMDLVVKNIPSDTKCGGFETTISYDKNIMNLTNINLSNIGNSADMKTTEISNGKIKLAWFSQLPYGNFTIATLTFKLLNNGSSNISLLNLALSNENGIKYNNIIINNSDIKINQLNQTIGIITIKNFEINKDISIVISINGAKTPIKNISGNIILKNISINSNPSQMDLFFKSFQYNITEYNNYVNLSYFIIPSKRDENKTMFNLLNIPIIINNSNYNITTNLKINDNLIKNISINKEKTTSNISKYKGLSFYVDNGYNTQTNLSIGKSKKIKLKIINIDKNLTNFSGCIFINNSLFNVLNYNVPSYSIIYNRINKSNIVLNNSNYLYYNISLTNGTNGTFSILEFEISPKINVNTSSNIFLNNISIYSNNTKINLPSRNLTVNVLYRGNNSPPIAKFIVSIEDNYKVHFYSLCYDYDSDNLNYFWDFGDGKNSTYENPIHNYNNYSEYTVKLKVNDVLNGSDEVVTVLPIKKYNPINYSFLNNTLINNSNYNNNNNINKTIYLNLTLNNVLPYKVNSYINFVDYKDIILPQSQYSFELKPNETKNIIIPINISKSSTIKWNIVYYPLIKPQKNVDLSYYIWNYKENIKFSSLKSNNNIKTINYTKIANINNSKIIIKLNKHKIIKNIVINKTINTNYSNNSNIIYYYLTSIVGFIIGLIVLKIK